MEDLTSKEKLRYARHIAIPEINVNGQLRLKAARVLVIGAGGLSCPMLQYLTAAGVGKIGIVDFDKVEESNLQRQILFDVRDVGQLKSEVARKKLQVLNPHIRIDSYPIKISRQNALDIIREYDVVADGSDNFPTRYLINDSCVLEEKPYVYGSVYRFEGQVSVFNYLYKDGSRSPNYRDLFPNPPESGAVLSCAEAGVMGVLTGVIGSLQANEVVKIITGTGTPLAGQLYILDSRDLTSQIIRFQKNPSTVIKELIDYDEFCNSKIQKGMSDIKEITVSELKKWLDEDKDFQLIDVREKYERDVCHIGGDMIPMGQILNSLNQIASDKDVVFYCRSGNRSAKVIKALDKLNQFGDLYNLKGGILAWSEEIDPSVPKY